MHKQTIILIVILATVTGILVFLAISNQNILRTNNNQQSSVPTPASVAKTAKVFFNPSSVSASNQPTAAEIMIDTGGSKIAGVQAELQYDPRAITNVRLSPASDATGFFGSSATVLFNDIKPDTGRISFAIALNPEATGKAGVGKIATISFTRALNATSSSTTINFIDKSLVSVLDAPNDSALKETSPLNITFTTTSPARTVPLTSPTFAPPVSPVQ